MTASILHSRAIGLTLGWLAGMVAMLAPASAATSAGAETKTIEAKSVDAEPLALETPLPAEASEPVDPAGSSSGSGLDLRLTATPTFGWIRTWDSASSPTRDTDLSSGAGMFAWGLSASAAPWRDLWLDVGFMRGGTQIDAPSGYVPLHPDVAWTRLRFEGGWTLHPEGWGPIREVKIGGGYNLEMFHSQEQTPTQLTPTWTHHDLVLRGRTSTRLMNDAVEAGVGLGLVPFILVTEQHGNSSGKSPLLALGIDVDAQAAYRVVQLAGAGDVLAGAALGWGWRRAKFRGRGNRLTPDGTERLRHVLSSFHRLTVLLTMTWRYPGGPGNTGSGAPGGGDVVDVVDVEDVEDVEDGEARLVGSRIEIGQPIHFKSGSAEIDMVRSRRALGAVARVFKRHPEIIKVEVVGHTDDRGSAAENMELSRHRAQAVVDALVERGVDKGRLVSRGMGATRPVAKNTDEKGRAANRRVEFEILERAGGDS